MHSTNTNIWSNIRTKLFFRNNPPYAKRPKKPLGSLRSQSVRKSAEDVLCMLDKNNLEKLVYVYVDDSKTDAKTFEEILRFTKKQTNKKNHRFTFDLLWEISINWSTKKQRKPVFEVAGFWKYCWYLQGRRLNFTSSQVCILSSV